MVDDIGAEGMRERVEARLGRKLEDYTLPPITVEPSHHIGVHAAEAGRALLHRRAGAPRPDLGRPDDRDRRPRRALRRRHPPHAPAELHRHRRPERVEVDERRSPSSSEIGFPLDINPVRGNSIACTGEPHCNFSVAETKTRLGRPDRPPRGALRQRHRRPAAAPRRLPARLRPALGRRPRLPGHDLARRGRRAAAGLRHLRPRRPRARSPRSASSLFRRVPTDELDAAVEGLVAGLARSRAAGESFLGVLPAADRRRAWRTGRPRAGRRHEQREEAEA